MIHEWTGEHARTLRLAKRMSTREFAAHLGISEATVCRWDTHPASVPRPFHQACLDTVLNKLTPDERARFETWPTSDNGYERQRKPTHFLYDKVDPFWTHARTVAALADRDIAGLYRLLQRRGVSQRRIAALTDQSQSEISEILGGRRVVNYEVLQRICENLGIPRGAMGLAYTSLAEDRSPTADDTSDATIDIPAQPGDDTSATPADDRADPGPSFHEKRDDDAGPDQGHDQYPPTTDIGSAPVTTTRNETHAPNHNQRNQRYGALGPRAPTPHPAHARLTPPSRAALAVLRQGTIRSRAKT